MSDSVVSTGRVLILFAHPALEKSRVNRHLVSAIEGLSGVTFNDLYEAYPEFDVDVTREQKLLLEHDIVVLHHPFFWYSTPAILKEWQDLVLEHGWAYGSDGHALRGKSLLSAVTTGGKADAYRSDGYNGHRVRDFLLPIAQTAKLCGMTWLAPFVAHGSHRMTDEQVAGQSGSIGAMVAGLIVVKLLVLLALGRLFRLHLEQQGRVQADDQSLRGGHLGGLLELLQLHVPGFDNADHGDLDHHALAHRFIGDRAEALRNTHLAVFDHDVAWQLDDEARALADLAVAADGALE